MAGVGVHDCAFYNRCYGSSLLCRYCPSHQSPFVMDRKHLIVHRIRRQNHNNWNYLVIMGIVTIAVVTFIQIIQL